MIAPDQLMRDLLTAAAIELLASYGRTGTIVDRPRATDDQLVGVLGFTGDQLAGSVTIIGDARTFGSCNPVEHGSVPAWVGELTNQIVGRFKNDLLMRSVDVSISIPCVLRAFRLVPLPRFAIEPIYIQLDGGQLALWLEVEGTPTFAEPDRDIIPPTGEALLF